MEIVDIKHYETKYKETSTSNAVSKLKCKIIELHKTYVFVPTDIAANNIVVVCRRYYIEVICNEVHCSLCLKVLTRILFTKLNKTPYKSRFISASSKCSTTYCLKYVNYSALTSVINVLKIHLSTTFGVLKIHWII